MKRRNQPRELNSLAQRESLKFDTNLVEGMATELNILPHDSELLLREDGYGTIEAVCKIISKSHNLNPAVSPRKLTSEILKGISLREISCCVFTTGEPESLGTPLYADELNRDWQIFLYPERIRKERESAINEPTRIILEESHAEDLTSAPQAFYAGPSMSDPIGILLISLDDAAGIFQYRQNSESNSPIRPPAHPVGRPPRADKVNLVAIGTANFSGLAPKYLTIGRIAQWLRDYVKQRPNLHEPLGRDGSEELAKIITSALGK